MTHVVRGVAPRGRAGAAAALADELERRNDDGDDGADEERPLAGRRALPRAGAEPRAGRDAEPEEADAVDLRRQQGAMKAETDRERADEPDDAQEPEAEAVPVDLDAVDIFVSSGVILTDDAEADEETEHERGPADRRADRQQDLADLADLTRVAGRVNELDSVELRVSAMTTKVRRT